MIRLHSHRNPYQMYLYPPKFLGNESAVSILRLTDLLRFILVLVSVIVTWFVFRIITSFNYKANKVSAKFDNHYSRLEAVWTMIPSVIIILTRVPSFNLLYFRDETRYPERSLKVEGNQWYWTYELETNFFDIEFDAGILSIDDITINSKKYYRLVCTSAILLPFKTWVRGFVSSADVLHSWALPTLGIKRDACPGRTNQVNVYSNRLGSFFGQCSEFCGRFHAYRPIELRFTFA